MSGSEHPPSRLCHRGVVVAIAVLLIVLCSSASATAVRKDSVGGQNWTVYHHDPAGSGVAGAINLSHLREVWVSPTLDGQLYGEPLVDDSSVIVATENDTVYSLNARTGAIRWSTHLGAPVPATELPCGDIKPVVGITSTPVIDPSRHEVFVVADVQSPSGPSHELFGLQLASGSIRLHQDVDPPGAFTPALLQRVALTLDGPNVVFGFGGNEGDCSTYHGWVVAVPQTGGPMRTYELDSASGESQGAVWMGGAAPIVDSNGDIWVAVGNGSVLSESRPYDDSDSVLELSPSLQLLQFFAPTTWASDNARDGDLGSSSPIVLPDGLIVQAGKSETAYLLSAHSLGGIGGQLAELGSFCGGNVDGGSAFVDTTAYLPCQKGTIALTVRASPPGLSIKWQTPATTGPPIVAGHWVWAISSNGTLDALNETSGAVVDQFSLGAVFNHFPTPSAGDGRLFAPGANQVFAFGS